jgi:hypothetical protein
VTGGPTEAERDVLESLRGAEIDRTTPLDALLLLQQLRARLEPRT